MPDFRAAIPNVKQLAQYRVNRANQTEGIRSTLYDFAIYPTAGVTSMTFFQLPKGQGITSASGAVAGSPKTAADTNMESAGTLPSPKMFLVESIEIVFIPGSVATANTYTNPRTADFIAVPADASVDQANDVFNVLNNGFLDFFIGSKSYLTEAPLFRFPPKSRVLTQASLATNSATTGSLLTLNTAAVGRPYSLQPRVLLEPTQNFNVSLNWGAAIPTPSGFNARIGVILDGILYRNSQ